MSLSKYLRKVTISRANTEGIRHNVSIDGISQNGIKSIYIDYEPNAIPEASITLNSVLDIDEDVAATFSFTPDSISECIKFLAMELQFDEELRNAWQSSIYSALVDLEKLEIGGANTCTFDKAGYILDRLLE